LTKYIDEPEAIVYHGNCLDELKNLADNSVDAIVTDPPYGLGDSDPDYILNALKMWIDGDRSHIPAGKGFMGKQWDAFVPPPAVWEGCFRVLKPGGHILVFAGTRTQDLMGLSVRMAGFEIRDSIGWIYGQGFPKSLDISKAIDKLHGAKRGEWPTLPMQEKSEVGEISKNRRCAICLKPLSSGNPCQCDRTQEAITEDAKKWNGWGTALKPALEPIIVGRKPLSEKNVANNVLKWGTGGINIDASRIGNTTMGGGTMPDLRDVGAKSKEAIGIDKLSFGQVSGAERIESENYKTGRFPSNIVFTHAEACVQVGTRTEKISNHNAPAGTFAGGEPDRGSDTSEYRDYEVTIPIYECVDGCPVKELDSQSGTTKSSTATFKASDYEERDTSTPFTRGDFVGRGDSGGASRFFQVTDAETDAIGRFPSNVIFGHTEDCVQIGVIEGSYSINATEEWTGFGQKERPDYEGKEQKVSTPVFECVEGCPVRELDEQTEGKITQGHWAKTKVSGYGEFGGGNSEYEGVGRKAEEKGGGASRFFYVAKASKKDRNEGIVDLPEKGKVYNGKSEESAGNAPGSVEDKFSTKPQANHHPTVKPTALMEYLVKLVTPVGGTVLDPFTGSGSTGKAAIRNDFKFIGIEMTEEYLPIIKARLEFEIDKKRSSLF